MGVSNREKGQLHLFEYPLRHEHVASSKKEPVLVLPPAVVHVQVQSRGQWVFGRRSHRQTVHEYRDDRIRRCWEAIVPRVHQWKSGAWIGPRGNLKVWPSMHQHTSGMAGKLLGSVGDFVLSGISRKSGLVVVHAVDRHRHRFLWIFPECKKQNG